MRINTNLTAMNTYSQYTSNTNKIASSVEKLSSGYAINSASDNAAGLAISEKMRAQIRGLDQASANAQDAVSLTQTAEGALGESTEILQRMREIAVQSASDTNSDEIDREALQDEFSQLQAELDDISSTTSYNTKSLLDGSIASSTTSLSDVTLSNSSMAVSTGSVSSGTYTFNVSVQEETAAVEAEAGELTASLGSTASETFSAATPATITTTGAQNNGNYTLSTTVNDNGSLTVTATGDNDQTFTATVDATTLSGLATTAGPLALTFESSTGAADGFSLTLTTASTVSTSDNGLEAVADAIDDVTLSVDGGVDEVDATYGVYASVTGGESVKLAAGDTSVTFSNGITVGFDELTATDVAVDQVQYDNANTIASLDISSYVTGETGSSTVSLSIATADTATDISGTYTLDSMTTDSDGNVSIVVEDASGNSYTATTTLTALNTMTSSSGVALSFEDADGNAVFTGDITSDATQTTITAATLASGGTDALGTVTSTGGGASLSSGILAKVGSTTDQSTRTTADGLAVASTADTTFSVTKSANEGLTFQVGANEGDTMTINIEKMDTETLGVNSSKVSTLESAEAAITAVDDAINTVSSQRAYLGAVQNRLDYKTSNLDTASENLTAAESQIRDVDMAKEMTEFTNSNILLQASTAMLAQANSLPQNVLSLIG